MKLSFSDKGWNESFYTTVKLLNENKISGFEISDVNAEVYRAEDVFAKGRLSFTERQLFENGVKVSCVGVPSFITDETFVKDAETAIKTAKELGSEFISVRTCADKDASVNTIKKEFPALIKKAENAGVTVLLETSGAFSDTSLAADVLGEFASDNFSALWDAYSTIFSAGEEPDVTVKNLGKHVKHVHIKDGKRVKDGVKIKLVGEGGIPVKDICETLRTVNYEGFISLEIPKDALGSLGDLEIVLPQFAGYMSSFEVAPSWRTSLYDNKAKTGKFIWEKETLIDLTFPQVLDRVAEEFPDQFAFKYTTLDYTRTYSEFRDEVNKVARALMAVGVKSGDHVAVWATNVPEWYLTFWATIKIGAVLVTVNTAYKIHELEYLLKQSDTHTLVMIKGYRDSDYQGIVNELCPELKNNKKGEKLRCKRLP
ncbi:MAG: AMP-binding protein, partial [Clostridia bacterium]|nr:AMP-binding protein [Clostridia bacterium]